MKGGFYLFNGKFYRENEPVFSGADLYRLSTGIRESFRTENNLVMFARENYNFLVDSMAAVALPLPADWNFSRFVNDVSRMLNKNHLYLASKVTIHLIPGNSGTEYLISAEEVPSGFYPVKEAGILIDFYDEGAKGSSNYSAYEPSSRLLWSEASRAATLLSRHNLILVNNKGYACESIGGSFGYLNDKTAIFPSPESQGYYPPIINIVKTCAEECGYLVQENREIKREDLLNADELFLIDNSLGIRPVLGLYARRFYTSGTTLIAKMLGDTARKTNPSV